MELNVVTVIALGAVSALSLCGAVNFPYPKDVVLIDKIHPENGEYIEYGDMTPEYYNLTLDFTGDHLVQGEVAISIKSLKGTDLIHLHAEDMTVVRVSVKRENFFCNQRGEPTTIDSTWRLGFPESHYLQIKTEEKLKVHNLYLVEIQFRYPYTSSEKGLRRSEFRTESGLLTTNFNPIYARKAFPCFDMPWFSSIFRLELKTKENHEVFSTVHGESKLIENGVKSTRLTFDKAATNELGFIVYNPNYVEDDLPLSEKILTNLVSWNLDGWKVLTLNAADKDIYWATNISMNIASPNILTMYKPYLNPKNLSVVGQEYQDPTRFFTWEFNIIKNMQFTQIMNLKRIQLRANSWENQWLINGLKVFQQYLYAAMKYSENKNKLMEMFTVSILMKAMSNDYPPLEKTIGNKAVNTPTILESFDEVSLFKAAAFIRTFYLMVGEKFFFDLINSFFLQYTNVLLEPIKFFEEIILYYPSHLKILGLDNRYDLNDVFESWSNQPGYQIIFVKKYEVEIVLSFNETVKKPTMSWIPISVYPPRNTNTQTHRERQHYGDYFTWWKPDDGKFNDLKMKGFPDGDCFTLNHNYLGYFRVLYDKKIWKTLTKCLIDINVFPPLNKAQLINDAFTFSKHRHLDYNTTLDLVSSFTDEIDIVPWIALHDNLQYLDSHLKDHPIFPKYNAFKYYLTKTFVKHVIDTHGMDVRVNDGQVVRSTRMLALRLGCEIGIKNVSRDIQTKFQNMLYNPGSLVHPDLQFIVLCYGTKSSDISVFSRLLKMHKSVQSLAIKRVIAESLGCAEDSNLADKIIDKIKKKDSGFSAEEKTKILQQLILGKKKVLYSVIDLLASMKDRVKEMFGGDGIRDIIISLSNRLVSRTKINLFNELLDYWLSKNVLSKTLDYNILRLAEDNVKSNRDWMIDSLPEVTDWINKFYERFSEQKQCNFNFNLV